MEGLGLSIQFAKLIALLNYTEQQMVTLNKLIKV